MELRMDLIVAILKWLSDQPEPCAEIPAEFTACPEVTPSIVRYHVRLCEEAGFIKQHSGMRNWHCLTWTGHQELRQQSSQM